MAGQIEPIARMAQQLSRLPGIGAKSALRLAYHIVSLPEDQVHELAAAIWQGRKAVKYCSLCGNYTVEDPCPICADERRRNGVLCVVRDPRDVAAMERMRDFKGTYHVLHDTISPMEGIGPEITLADWPGFIPEQADGLGEVAYAKTYCRQGIFCHTEAGRK